VESAVESAVEVSAVEVWAEVWAVEVWVLCTSIRI
jgi:hypothetical protein